MRDKGYAEEILSDELPPPVGKVWYLPHHGVYHKQKKTIRVVFDCSAKYHGVSINDFLLQGPDLINNLVGVLLRFRSGQIAFSGDIEKMFYRVRVPRSHSDFFRFFWFKDDNIYGDPVEYRINVHVFGAKSSPSCANFALKHSIVTHNSCDRNNVRNVLSRSFYVDDLMVSANNESVAIDLANEAITILINNGFNLTGFSSNCRNLLNNLPIDKLSKNIKASDNFDKILPSERALGLIWNAETDKFCYEFNESKNRVPTRRGILSDIFSIYDPFFIAAPVIVPAKSIFQRTCTLKLNWDDPLPKDLEDSWKCWLKEIKSLENFEIDRCFSKDICSYDRVELHLFSDGSETAYGSVAYLRFVADDIVKCSIVMSKVRLTPKSKGALKTIPRIELNAAKLSIMLYLKLKKELNYDFNSVHFWTDSLIVLGYIKSENRKFQRFVTNRVSFVRNHSSVNQWHHVPGTLNPADMLSRGISSVNKFLCCRSWVAGPQFLYCAEREWPVTPENVEIPPEEREIVHKAKVATDEQGTSPTEKLLNSTSSWLKLRYRVSAMLRLSSILKNGKVKSESISVSELSQAEVSIWRYPQVKHFTNERDMVSRGASLPKRNVLLKVSPFIDQDGLMRSGGRLQNSDLPYSVKHPIILPKSCWPVEVTSGNFIKISDTWDVILSPHILRIFLLLVATH